MGPLQIDTSGAPGLVPTGLIRAELDSDVSGSGGGDDPNGHGMFLTLKDHDHIRLFIQEFTFRGLLPHIEKNIRQLNDQVCVSSVCLRVKVRGTGAQNSPGTWSAT